RGGRRLPRQLPRRDGVGNRVTARTGGTGRDTPPPAPPAPPDPAGTPPRYIASARGRAVSDGRTRGPGISKPGGRCGVPGAAQGASDGQVRRGSAGSWASFSRRAGCRLPVPPRLLGRPLG